MSKETQAAVDYLSRELETTRHDLERITAKGNKDKIATATAAVKQLEDELAAAVAAHAAEPSDMAAAGSGTAFNPTIRIEE